MPSITPPEKKDRKIALVVIDVQRKFTGGSIPEKVSEDKIETINMATKMFHENGRPVIFVHYDGPCECSKYSKNDGDEYLKGIITDPRDIIVHKDSMNSFTNTKLAEVVKECGCDSILLAGMMTQFCVMGTYFGSFEHGLSPYLLIGGTIASEDKYDDAAYALCKTFSLDEVKENLRKTQAPKSTKIYGSKHSKYTSTDQ